MRMARGAGKGADLYALLYTSELASESGRDVMTICEQSRRNNQRDGITGLLVFDGIAFCQYVEGGEREIARLRERIDHDPRHRDVRVLHVGPSGRRRRLFPSWRLGYAYQADPAAIERMGGLRGATAVDAFVASMHGGDDGDDHAVELAGHDGRVAPAGQ